MLAVSIGIYVLNKLQFMITGFEIGSNELAEAALFGALLVLAGVILIIAFTTLKHRSFIITLVTLIALISLFTLMDLIVEAITMFLMVPLAGLVFILFGGALIVSVIAASKYKETRATSLLPMVMQVGALLLVMWVPLSYLYINANFALFKDQREKVVAKVNSGELKPNVKYDAHMISLGDSFPNLSVGGNQVVVYEYRKKKYVFFYTFRGFLDSNSSGFIYVPKGGDPQNCSEDVKEQPRARIVSLENNWYYVSHYECKSFLR